MQVNVLDKLQVYNSLRLKKIFRMSASKADKNYFETTIQEIHQKLDDIFKDEVLMISGINDPNISVKGSVITRLREDHEFIKQWIDVFIKELENNLQIQRKNFIEKDGIEFNGDEDYIKGTTLDISKSLSREESLSDDMLLLNQPQETYNKLISWWKILDSRPFLTARSISRLHRPPSSKNSKSEFTKLVKKRKVAMKTTRLLKRTNKAFLKTYKSNVNGKCYYSLTIIEPLTQR